MLKRPKDHGSGLWSFKDQKTMGWVQWFFFLKDHGVRFSGSRRDKEMYHSVIFEDWHSGLRDKLNQVMRAMGTGTMVLKAQTTVPVPIVLL